MPLNLPPSLSLFKPKDLDAQRFLGPIERAVTPVLQFLNSTFDYAAAGAVRILKPLVASTLTSDTLNVGGTSNLTGGVNTPTGFKSVVDMGYVYRANAVAGTKYQAVQNTQSGDASPVNYQFPTLFQPMYAGSIVAIQTWSMGTVGGSANVQLYKNSTNISGAPTIDVNVGTVSQYSGAYILFPRGQYPFIYQTYYSCSVSFSTAGNQAVMVRLYVEFNA